MSVGRSITRRLGGFASRLSDLWRLGTQPPPGLVYRYDNTLDGYRRYVSDALSFSQLKTLLRAGDSGDLATVPALFEEMEGKDLHLQGVANTRRAALTGLDWEIVPAADVQDRRRFEDPRLDKILDAEAAAMVEETLVNLDSFEPALEHLATAIGPNLAVVEMVWKGTTLDELVRIPSSRLTMRADDLRHVRVITAEVRDGIIADPRKFVVYIPQSRAVRRERWRRRRCRIRCAAICWKTTYGAKPE